MQAIRWSQKVIEVARPRARCVAASVGRWSLQLRVGVKSRQEIDVRVEVGSMENLLRDIR